MGTQPGQVHLVLVGTSILSNAYIHLKSRGEAACLKLLAACVDRDARDPSLCGRLEANQQCLNTVSSLLNQDPYRFSAELNAMSWVLDRGCSGVRRVVLYPTDTPESRTAARLLERYLAARCSSAAVEVKAVGRVGDEFWPMLLQLIQTILPDIVEETRRGSRVYLNATAGFKPESTAAVVAALAAAPVAVYYRHEAMKRTVFLPPIPLRIDERILRDHASKLRLLAYTARAALNESGKPITIDVVDPTLADIAWALTVIAAAQGSPDKLRLDEKAIDALEVIASIYESVLARLSQA